MNLMNNEEQAIKEVVRLYFMGTFQGNREYLKTAFHSDAHITGSFNGQICDWSLDEFIKRVTVAPTSAQRNEVYNKEIIFLDCIGDMAIVKARVLVGNYTFFDYITLLKIDDRWVIRNKSFTT